MQKVIKHHSPNEEERYIQMGLFRGLNSGLAFLLLASKPKEISVLYLIDRSNSFKDKYTDS